MQKKIGLLLLVVIASIAATITVIHSQTSTDSNSNKHKKVDVGELPIADYDAPLPGNAQERSQRLKRNKSRNSKFNKPEDARKFMITEERNSSYGGFGSHEPAEPAIPSASSDVVVIGELADSAAFLTEDKVSVYSEFRVDVKNVLKNSTAEVIDTESLITISRGGGAVKFSSGKVINKLFGGKPMPLVKSKYLLFLKYDKQNEDYPLITAYKLENGSVTPLDGIDIDGSIVQELASHQTYKGMSETEFVELVRQTIKDSKNIFEKENL